MSIKWCECKRHKSRDFGELTDFYCAYFIPSGWMLDYKTIDTTDDKYRHLFITGYCSVCGGFMRSGTSDAVNYSGDKLIGLIFQTMNNHRPYDGRHPDGGYTGMVPERSLWYREQDRLQPEKRAEQFLSIFHEKDRAAVQGWLTNMRKGS